MRRINKSLFYLLSVCLVISLMAGCTASSAIPPASDGEDTSTYYIEIDFLGTREMILVDSYGRLRASVEILSLDGGISLYLKEGTVILDKDEKPLEFINVKIDPDSPSPPTDTCIIGAVYDFEPRGVSFNPPAKLTLGYSTQQLPEGVGEGNIYIACYGETGWEKLPYKYVDTNSHQITTQIDRSAGFAVLAPKESRTPNTSSGGVEMVEVIYFHRAQRCQSCIYAEEGTIYTLETYFQDEMASGKMTFRSVNLNDEENTAIVEKYNAYTSSLFINAIIDGTDQIKEVTEIWFLVGDDQAFVEEVRSEIAKSLGGGEG